MAVGVQRCTHGFVSTFFSTSGWRFEHEEGKREKKKPNTRSHRAIIGCLGGGYLADKFGRKLMLHVTLVLSYAAITMEFVATTNELFFGGKFLNGFATGCIATICVSYIGEVSLIQPASPKCGSNPR